MTREADVVRSLVEMADTLVDDYDVVDLLTGLTDRCVTLLGVSAAGVMLASPSGSLGLVASSSEAMRLLELFELQEQEGPCLDAFRSGGRVDEDDLQAGSGRWPLFSAAALSILQHRASAEAQRLNEQLSAALSSRIVIEQAKGVISERAGIDLAEAFARLRGYARNANLPLTDVARAAVDGTLDPGAWASARG
jgi:hypothetical protein